MSKDLNHVAVDVSSDPFAGNDWEETTADDHDDEPSDADDDVDARAEAEARRLGDQLLAQIGAFAAQRELEGQPVESAQAPPADPTQQPGADDAESTSGGDDGMIETIKVILEHASENEDIQAALTETIVPDTDGKTLLSILSEAVKIGSVPSELVEILGELIAVLAGSEDPADDEGSSTALPPPKPANKKGKRKREDDTSSGRTAAAPQRPSMAATTTGLDTEISNAISVITQALELCSNQGGTIDPTLITSVQLQLHQVFLFAATSANAGVGGPDGAALLQEISGLIQMLGVLSGVQITPPPPALHPHPAMYHPQGPLPPPYGASPPVPMPMYPHPSMYPPSYPFTEIGTAVYPCVFPGCGKTFARLVNLRCHQRGHMMDRPFRCDHCPAAFARNHDLKRHSKSHGTRVYKCGGCDRTFSRRDALKRHKGNAKADMEGKGKGKGKANLACAESPVEMVDIEDAGVRPRSRVHIDLEEGELSPQVLAHAQSNVTHLHTLLQSLVTQALGNDKPSTSGPRPGVAVGGNGTGWPALTALVSSQRAEPSGKEETSSKSTSTSTPTIALSEYGLTEEQKQALEQAIAVASEAARAQAEAEARMEEEADAAEGEGEGEDDEGWNEEGEGGDEEAEEDVDVEG